MGVTTTAGQPVTISSGITVPRGQENVVVTPPPQRSSRASRSASGSEGSTASSYHSLYSLAPPPTSITGASRTLPPASTRGYSETFTSPAAASGTTSDQEYTGFDGTYSALGGSARSSRVVSSGRQPLLFPAESEGSPTPSRLSGASGLSRSSAICQSPGARSRAMSTPSRSDFVTAQEASSVSGAYESAQGAGSARLSLATPAPEYEGIE